MKIKVIFDDAKDMEKIYDGNRFFFSGGYLYVYKDVVTKVDGCILSSSLFTRKVTRKPCTRNDHESFIVALIPESNVWSVERIND
jgi:hypothetical protein